MNIYLFSVIPFQHLSQRPQKLTIEFYRQGHRVTYINPPWNVLSLFIRDKLSLGDGEQTKLPNEIKILTIPLYGIPKLKKSRLPINLSASQVLKYLDKKLYQKLNKDKQNVAIVQDPRMEEFVRGECFDLICYDCLDDSSVFGIDSVENYQRHQKSLIEKSSIIFYTADALAEDMKNNFNPSVPMVNIKNGVDYDWFVSQAAQAVGIKKLLKFKKPIVGYLGALSDWIDPELIIATAKLCSQTSFVLIGPESKTFKHTKKHYPPNLIHFGEVPYSKVPALVNLFDVCILPFKRNSVAESTDPVKLYEYFSLGKPVISTPMRQLTKYKQDNLLWFAETPEAFANFILDVLKTETDQQRQKRKEVAKEHSWETSAKKIIQSINLIVNNG